MGLDNWIKTWYMYTKNVLRNDSDLLVTDDDLEPDRMWTRTGFSQYAEEYWVLAKLLFRRLLKGRRDALLNPTENGSGTRDEEGAEMSDQHDQPSMWTIQELVDELQTARRCN